MQGVERRVDEFIYFTWKATQLTYSTRYVVHTERHNHITGAGLVGKKCLTYSMSEYGVTAINYKASDRTPHTLSQRVRR
jgi:hypothetical protein